MNIFVPMLAVLLIGLKLTGYITWSWWLVLLPLWIGPIVLINIIVIYMMANGVAPRITVTRKKK